MFSLCRGCKSTSLHAMLLFTFLRERAYKAMTNSLPPIKGRGSRSRNSAESQQVSPSNNMKSSSSSSLNSYLSKSASTQAPIKLNFLYLISTRASQSKLLLLIPPSIPRYLKPSSISFVTSPTVTMEEPHVAVWHCLFKVNSQSANPHNHHAGQHRLMIPLTMITFKTWNASTTRVLSTIKLSTCAPFHPLAHL